MTPAEAYEHVRLRRPRVLLAPAQWQVSCHQILHASVCNYFSSPTPTLTLILSVVIIEEKAVINSEFKRRTCQVS
jgi:hypothetical protein